MDIRSLLTKEQLDIVNCGDGPVMVFAGAGSGKTRTLTHRIAKLVHDGVDPKRILAITFTNKATEEMRNRLYTLISKENANLLCISTFHGFCCNILRSEIETLDYFTYFKIIDEEDQKRLLSRAINECGYDGLKETALLKVIKYVKNFGRLPIEDYQKEIYYKYEEILFEQNSLDFEDLLSKVVELFNRFPEVLNKYQGMYDYVFCDEYQDTNNIQYHILNKLVEKHRNIFVVGDDDQSIYSFRGCNFRNMYSFLDDYKDCKKFYLMENFRSSQNILNYANRLIKHNIERHPKQMYSKRFGQTSDVVELTPYNDKLEGKIIVEKIKQHLASGISKNKIAVLYRNNNLKDNVERELLLNKIDYKVYGGISFLSRKVVKDILSMLRILISDDELSFERVIPLVCDYIGSKTLEQLFIYAKNHKQKIINALPEYTKIVSDTKAVALNKFLDFYNDCFNLVKDDSNLESLVELIRSNFNIPADDEVYQSLLSLIVDINSSELTCEKKIIKLIDSSTLHENIDKNKDGIVLSTFHSSKGLEFDIVFMIGMEENIFPNYYKLTTADLEEERRLCYVGMTRACNKLYIVSNVSRTMYGSIQKYSRSRFITESKLEVNYE